MSKENDVSEIEEDYSDESDVIDEAEKDEAVSPASYDITSFGADYDVEGLVKRQKRGDVFVPPFQRDYVWNQKEASRLIESLLLGLPVPGIFLAREKESNKLLVIDGQQRLKTLLFFFEGVFNPRPGQKSQKVFRLVNVQQRFAGKTYKTLEEPDRIRLNDTIIHATIVKQESPKNDDTSIYHIFERLNYGGRKLTPQEIRVAIYHGPLVDLLRDLNDYASWRAIFGKKNSRLKDQELILRYLALNAELDSYKRPMADFLSKFAATNKVPTPEFESGVRLSFTAAIDLVYSALGTKAFRPEGTLNAAVLDSVLIGVSRNQTDGKVLAPESMADRYNKLLADPEYQEAVSRSTADEAFVRLRIQKAIDAFDPAK